MNSKADLGKNRTNNLSIQTTMDRLGNVLKAYSIYDPAVGYVQGLNFLAAPILLQCSEPEAFSLLVTLMKQHDLRSMYLPDMPGLHTKLYQFDRLLEDNLPKVHIHLQRAGVTSSMYASQWFLTLFAYKFPIPLVLRIFDIVVLEGLNSILKFGIALIQKNAQQILTKTKLDELLDFLKEGLFATYQHERVRSPGVAGMIGLGAETTYRIEEMVQDALNVTLDESKLKTWEVEYLDAAAQQRTRDEEHHSIRQSNISLQATVRRLEESLSVLNAEHVALANDLIAAKMSLVRIEDENEALQATVIDLKQIIDSQPAEVEARLQQEMQQLIEKAKVTSLENDRLEDGMSQMEREMIDLKMKYATEHEQYSLLSKKMDDLKKSFNA